MGRKILTKSGFKVYSRCCFRCKKRIKTKVSSRKVICDDCNLLSHHKKFLSSEVKQNEFRT